MNRSHSENGAPSVAMPPEGIQRSPPAKTMITRRPNQKVGTDRPTIAPVVAA